MAKKLTNKQQRFVEEYLIDLNATQAAIRAGYSVNGAGQTADNLLKKTEVKEAVEQAIAQRSKRTGVNQDRIIQELAKIAFANYGDVVDGYGRIRANATADDLACIEYMKVKQSESDTGSSEEREVKLHSKMKALELLGKHIGMFSDKVEVKIPEPVIFMGAENLED